jgi:hypothetical protein
MCVCVCVCVCAKRLADVFELFRRANLQLQPEECFFVKDKFTNLGFELSCRGIEASLDKMKAVQNFQIARSVQDVRSFLGLASFLGMSDWLRKPN